MEALSDMYFLPVILPLVVASIIYFIESLNISEFERKLMTSLEKIKSILSLAFLGALITSIVITWILIFKEDVEILLTFISSFVVSIVIMFIILMVIELVFNYKYKKYELWITLNDQEQWKVIKVTNRNKLLLKRDGKYKIINDYFNYPITVVNKKEELPKVIEEYEKLIKTALESLKEAKNNLSENDLKGELSAEIKNIKNKQKELFKRAKI